MESHPLRMRGLKLSRARNQRRQHGSHPLRMRGLKPKCRNTRAIERSSHPLRMRGLKPIFGKNQNWKMLCRILYGCVD